MSRRSGKAWAAKEATQKINSISKRRMRGSLNDDSELIIFRQSGTELFNNQYTTPALKMEGLQRAENPTQEYPKVSSERR